jgi:TetR/AcrR family transcriptional regulator, transcriptional repressor for nem operon
LAVTTTLVTPRASFRRSIEAGQQDGSIAGACAAGGLARLPLSVLIGVRVLARTCPQRDVLEGAANNIMALLETGASGRGSEGSRPDNHHLGAAAGGSSRSKDA